MPSSPDVTYFRLEVTEVSTGRLAASVLFLCVLVSDSGSLGKRPWESTDRITSEEYLAGAYQRLVRHLLDPIKHQPNVTEFMDLGCLQIAATTEPAQVLDALDVAASLIVPAFPLPVFPMRMELERLPHLFACKDNRTSDKEKPKDKEAKDVPWKALAEKHYNKGVPAVVAAPRGLTLRSRVEGEPGENRIMMTYTEQDCCCMVTHGDYEESWRQLSLKSELTNQGYAADRHRRDELKRGMPASPYVTHFRLEVEKKSTGERATSAVFRCYIVPDTVQPGYRSWTEADGIIAIGPDLEGIVASPRALSQLPDPVRVIRSTAASWSSMIYGEIEESWRQLWLKLPADTREDLGETRARSELRRGMPASPDMTIFRLEVKESSNQQRLASATFRCCIVPGNGPHGRRQWTLEDGVPELDSLEDIVEPPRVAKTGLSHSHALSHRQRKIYGQDFVVAGSRRF
ncbi:hypothetical protein JCM16303_006969 [Sporobolomyces ruberrimus]